MQHQPQPVSEGPSRFLFYSHDGVGLGHVRRNLAVADALTEADQHASVLLAASAEEVDRLGVPPHVDLLRLPGLCKLGNDQYASRRLPVSSTDIRTVRSAVLTAAVESFRPTVVLVDKHPFGAGGELRGALEVARAGGARTALGLRDILDEPATVAREWRRHALPDGIADNYDQVLVYGNPEVFDPVREYALPERVAALTRYCGYVTRPSEAMWPSGEEPCFRRRGDEPLVLATAGGGEDGFTFLSAFIEAAAGAPWQAAMVSGPQCEENDRRELAARSKRAGVAFQTFVPGLASSFREADALVCMGGYNTLTEAAAVGVPTVCVPRVAPRKEQLMRARAFARLGLLRLVEPSRLGPLVLRAEIAAALGSQVPPPRPNGHVLDFDGAARAARHLLELAGVEEPADGWAAEVVPYAVP